MQESRRETRAASGYWALQTVEVWALTRDAVSVVSGCSGRPQQSRRSGEVR